MRNMNKKILALVVMLSIINVAIAAQVDIGNLKNVTFAPHHIKWTWKDPTDANFSYVNIYIDGIYVENVAEGVQSYNATGLEADTEYKISTKAVNKKGKISSTWINDSARTAPETSSDNKPPSNIRNLRNVTYAPYYIKWTWADPFDSDFDAVMVYINDEFKENVTKGLQTYNATGLEMGTKYKISTKTVDSSGNVNNTWKNHTAETSNVSLSDNSNAIESVTNLKNISYDPRYINWTWKDPSDSNFSRVMVYLNGNYKRDVTKNVQFYNTSSDTTLNSGNAYTISTKTVDKFGNVNDTWKNHTAHTANEIVIIKPNITVVSEPADLKVIVGTELFFDISIDQNVKVTWKLNNETKKTENDVRRSNYTFNSSSKDRYNLSVTAENGNGTSYKQWQIIYYSDTYRTGNRIWDGSKPEEYSLTYTWDARSFSGFYYNIDDNVGNESITFSMDSYTDRSIEEGDIVYVTTPNEVNFDHSEFGKYQVIGFMAEKYFAGYTGNTSPPKPKDSIEKVSLIEQKQLHKVLMDDSTKRILSVGGTVTLRDGYVIKAKDIGDRTMLISLLRNGEEVDSAAFLNAGETYIYKKRVGSTELPIIMVKFDTVFMGNEVQMAVLKGIFQISETYTKIDNGDRYGVMEITETSADKIRMKNENGISLSQNSKVDLMGNVKILVADSSVVRFGLYAEKTGAYEVRGTVFNEKAPILEWNPYNFGYTGDNKQSIGFYYDMDEDIGNEKLKIEKMNGRTIEEGGLVYSTYPQEVSFGYSNFGKYKVIGFMAEKYFAGYTGNSIANENMDVMSQNQLHKVLLDDDEKRVIGVGGTLTLREGYVLRAKEIDVGVGTGQMWFTLLKDGNEIDDDVIAKGDTYVYAKKVGSIDDLPIIAVRIDTVFRGQEINAAFIKGIFQISETYTKIGTGDDFGKMEITDTGNKITMKNKESISLSQNSKVDIMGDIKFKVADSNKLRFYPFVLVKEKFLELKMPTGAYVGDSTDIKVTEEDEPIRDVNINIEPSVGYVGMTNINGTFNYTWKSKGRYNVTASKVGYKSISNTINIDPQIEHKLSINIPSAAYINEKLTISVMSNNTPIDGANISYDNKSIGYTNVKGILEYDLKDIGMHSFMASKSGYISAARDIDVKDLYVELKALDIDIPYEAFVGSEIMIKSNITNIGNKKDIASVILLINGNSTGIVNASISPKDKQEINFTHKFNEKGNYTIEIMEQKKTLEIKDKPVSLGIIVGMITVLGIIVIYFLTRNRMINRQD